MGKSQSRKILFICVFIDIVTVVAVLILRKNLPPLVPLFYGLPVSSDQLVASWGLIIPPLVSIVLVIFDFGITRLIKDVFLQKIMTGLILVLTALSVITVVEIISLVGVFA